MKNITHLDDFQPLYEKNKPTPEKAKFNFDISANSKKASKIQKTLIDVHQFLMEMSDEITALKLNYSHLDADSEEAMNNMKSNIDNMLYTLKKEDAQGSKTGMLDNCGRLVRNLEKLKHGYLEKKGVQ